MNIQKQSIISGGRMFPVLAWIVSMGCIGMGAYAASYKPSIDPANFQATVDNPYFPLTPGTTWKYLEKEKGEIRDNEVAVMADRKMILGVSCVVVHDKLAENGVLKEDTYDWYAQDKQGNVWYFGEDTKEFKANGKVETKGSWEAGVKGAQPGIIMSGEPKIGIPYRQEYLRGEAEDMAEVAAFDESVTVPAGSFTGCLRTKEWSMLESGSSKKWFSKNIGFIKSVSAAGEVAELVSVTKP